MFLKKLLPSLHVNSIYDIDLWELKRKGIKGIITDLDNTLVEWDRSDPTPELIEWFKSLEEHGFRCIVVSNNNTERVRRFVQPLGIPFISMARKPSLRAFRESLNRLGCSEHEAVVIGDQLFTDILGGNRLGLYTILVVPVTNTDGFLTRFNRMMERKALKWMRKKGMLSWEENR